MFSVLMAFGCCGGGSFAKRLWRFGRALTAFRAGFCGRSAVLKWHKNGLRLIKSQRNGGVFGFNCVIL